MNKWCFALVMIALAACASPRSYSRMPSRWTAAAGETKDTELARTCATLWELRLRQSPIWATELGDPRYYGKMPAHTPADRAHELEATRRLWRGARTIDPGRLNAEDRVTLELMLEELEIQIAEQSHPLAPHTWNINGLGGPQSDLLSLAADQPRATELEREQLLERWGRFPSYISTSGEDLREGLANGRAASRHAVQTVIAQLDALLATPLHESPLVAPAAEDGRWVVLDPAVDSNTSRSGPEITAEQFDALEARVLTQAGDVQYVYLPADDDPLEFEERARLLEECLRLVGARIYPAFERYRSIVANEVLPAARSDEEPGFGALAGGLEYYRLQVRRHTSLRMEPDEIHQLGLDELARIHEEMREIGSRVFGTRDLAEIQRRLREDPELHFNTAEEIEATAAACVARAEAAVPALFGILPAAPCEVVRVPDHEAPDTTIAYYRGPAPDGSRPGRYYVNTYAPETRPRYEAEVLAYHEAVPGHHTQIAVAQELTGLPLVRRHGGVTAYVEGWALYTERLCEELDLYSGDTDRLGVLSFDSWRASRLVVDTGLHAFGWSRQRAIDFLIDNTLLAPNNCANEVDRYIAWPGQALAYKLGQREILALRAEAEQSLGERFELSDFHDVVLGSGAVSLGALRSIVEAWIAEQSGDDDGVTH
jgi:uncharacterized protein (DUF885 family)